MLFSSALLAYIPHGHCYLWQTGLVSLHITADLLIALAYFSIPLALIYFARKRQDLPFKGVFILFGAFIVFCGTTHLMAIWTLWHPDYWQAGALKAATAFVSVMTAVTLVPVVPKALNLRSPADLEAANVALAQEVRDRQAAETQLQAQNQALTDTLNELHKTQIMLVQNEKMSSLGQLVAGIAHELNNPVSVISGNLPHIQTYADDLFRLLQAYQTCYPNVDECVAAIAADIDLAFLQEDLPRLLGSVKAGCNRIREIVLSLRSFSCLDESGIKSIHLHTALNNTLVVLSNRLRGHGQRPDIQVETHYGDLPTVECEAGALNQVFLNLLSNAIEAIEARWSADNEPAEQGRITIHTDLNATGMVRVAIADNGIGIPLEVQRRMFDPFFTTKPVGQGTGMGLAISYQVVVEQHRGTLTCESQVGEGTTVVMEIPVRSRVSRNPRSPFPSESSCPLPGVQSVRPAIT